MLLLAFHLLKPGWTYQANMFGVSQVRTEGAAEALTSVICAKNAVSLAWGQWIKEQLTSELAGSLFLAAAAACDSKSAAEFVNRIKLNAVPAAVFQQPWQMQCRQEIPRH
jgi:hypothetical protein